MADFPSNMNVPSNPNTQYFNDLVHDKALFPSNKEVKGVGFTEGRKELILQLMTQGVTGKDRVYTGESKKLSVKIKDRFKKIDKDKYVKIRLPASQFRGSVYLKKQDLIEAGKVKNEEERTSISLKESDGKTYPDIQCDGGNIPKGMQILVGAFSSVPVDSQALKQAFFQGDRVQELLQNPSNQKVMENWGETEWQEIMEHVDSSFLDDKGRPANTAIEKTRDTYGEISDYYKDVNNELDEYFAKALQLGLDNTRLLDNTLLIKGAKRHPSR